MSDAPPKPLLTPGRWRAEDPRGEQATPRCPKCNSHMGIRLGMWRDNGRDAWLCDQCGEWEAV